MHGQNFELMELVSLMMISVCDNELDSLSAYISETTSKGSIWIYYYINI